MKSSEHKSLDRLDSSISDARSERARADHPLFGELPKNRRGRRIKKALARKEKSGATNG